MLAAFGATAMLVTASAGASFPGTNGKIAYSSIVGTGDAEIFSVNPDGSSPTQLTFNPPAPTYGGLDGEPAYSADGERIVFVRNEPGPPSDLWITDATGQNQTALTVSATYEYSPAFSPDGRRIVFARDDGTNGQIFVMDVNGQNEVQLTGNATFAADPTFSPDGQRIAFMSDDGSGFEISLMDANGQNPTPVTNNDFDSFSPSFSPDGQRIAFVGAPGGTDFEIFVIDLSSGVQTQLTDNSVNDVGVAFSPDGQRIAFTHNDGGGDFEVFAMDANGQNQTPVTSNGFNDRTPDWQPLNPPACDVSAAAKQKSLKSVAASVTCANENATVVAGGTIKAPKLPKAGAQTSKSKKITLPPVTISVPANTPTSLSLSIPKRGTKALKKAARAGKKSKGTLTFSATDDFGEQAVEPPLKIKFKKK